MSFTPMAAGSPMCRGAPCTLGIAPESWTAFTIRSWGMGRIDMTILPLMEPAGTQSTPVRYIETLRPIVLCRISMPASTSSDSNENEQPITNETRSSRQ